MIALSGNRRMGINKARPQYLYLCEDLDDFTDTIVVSSTTHGLQKWESYLSMARKTWLVFAYNISSPILKTLQSYTHTYLATSYPTRNKRRNSNMYQFPNQLC
ncbi:hypothetical protein ACMFMF_005369 [Clarireedia jacksonii]